MGPTYANSCVCKRDVNHAGVSPSFAAADTSRTDVWQIDVIINERGFFCDVALARR
jgi:hypothetical protein